MIMECIIFTLILADKPLGDLEWTQIAVLRVNEG